ncbi:FAD:protein FMN transferase [Cryobacterium frigoriphilum]|uniref:FAD:protein FMN transferase n=2 Tax=Cryobacterium frigoriphilum TaxID=1259150 RepID=A0A4R8ZYV2_9MICO|nr:FAD:protein FMN transferase [Cryobacterium frigoriphilum]
MGTVVSVRLNGGLTDAGGPVLRHAARAAVAGVFDRWDDRFSLYRPGSELSRVASGAIRLPNASRELRDCYALALDWRDRTDGVFTPHRGDGVIDLSGIVKALAIVEAGSALESLGQKAWSINAGGDILVSGCPNVTFARRLDPNVDPDWVVALVNPLDRLDLLATVPLRAPLRAVATSGSAERGDHIWTPAPGIRSPFRQVSVLAADIVTADVLATAIVAGGEPMLNQCAATYEIEVLAVLQGGGLLATPGLRR